MVVSRGDFADDIRGVRLMMATVLARFREMVGRKFTRLFR